MTKDKQLKKNAPIIKKDPSDYRFQELHDKISAQENASKSKEKTPFTSHNDADLNTSVGKAYRIMIELVVGIVIGLVIGVWLDQIFLTSPLFVLIMLFLGIAAGIWNIYRWIAGYQGSLGFIKKKKP